MLMPVSANGAFDDDARAHGQGDSVRIPFVHGCLLTTRARARGGLVCNLSVNGVYVTLDEPLPEPGDAVHVSVQIPGQQPLLEADTVVTWQNRRPSLGPDSLPPGVGLRFVGLGPSYQSRIRSLVAQHQSPSAVNELVLPNLPHSGLKRIPYVQPCTFSSKTGTVSTLICNLSRMGAYVTLPKPVELAEGVQVSFVTHEGARFDLRGVVAWCNPEDPRKLDPLAPGCGVRFVGLAAEEERRLRTLVDSLAATA